jgi:hypothetical protein
VIIIGRSNISFRSSDTGDPSRPPLTTTCLHQHMADLHVTTPGASGVDGDEAGAAVNKHMLLVHTLSPGGESSHDSCYDSDSSPLGSRENR